MSEPKSFYDRREWQSLRYSVLRKYGFACMACGDKASQLHVDHIKPRSIYPELALDFNNLQVLCRDCNFGKSNAYSDDHRKVENKAEHDSYVYKKSFDENQKNSPEVEAFMKNIREMLEAGKRDQS